MTELPKGWVIASLDELTESVRNGVFVSRPTDAPPGEPILRISAVRPMRLDSSDIRFARQLPANAEAARLALGDLLFTRYSGTRDFVGACAVVGEDSVGTPHPDKLIRVVPNDDLVSPHYLEAFCSSPPGREWLEGAMKTTAGQTGLAGSDLKRLPVALAPRNEQERIVTAIEEAFSKLDSGEAGLRTIRQLLKRMREAILAAAVTGRLLPASGDNAFDDRTLELLRAGSAPGLDPRTRRLRDSDVAPPVVSLPPGWRWVRWSQVGRCQNGRPFPSADYCDDGVPLLRPGNLAANGQVSWTVSNTRYLPERYTATCPDLVVGASEVVMNLTAQSLKDDFLGRVCITGPNDRCLLNQRLARLTPFAVTPAYAVLCFRSYIFREFVKTLNSGSLIQHMYTHQVDSCWMPLPPPADQDALVVEVDRNLSVIESLQAFVGAAGERSAGLRRSVLKAAFEGRLVPQDPSDEPASVLLDRIRAERTAQPVAKRRARQTA